MKEQASENNIPYSNYLVCIIFSLGVQFVVLLLKKWNQITDYPINNMFNHDNKTEKYQFLLDIYCLIFWYINIYLYLCDTEKYTLYGNRYACLMSERLNKFDVAMCMISYQK